MFTFTTSVTGVCTLHLSQYKTEVSVTQKNWQTLSYFCRIVFFDCFSAIADS